MIAFCIKHPYNPNIQVSFSPRLTPLISNTLANHFQIAIISVAPNGANANLHSLPTGPKFFSTKFFHWLRVNLWPFTLLYHYNDANSGQRKKNKIRLKYTCKRQKNI